MGSAVLDGILKKRMFKREFGMKKTTAFITLILTKSLNHLEVIGYRNIGTHCELIRSHASLIPNTRKSITHEMTNQKHHK